MTTLRKIRNDFFKTSIDFETIDLFLRGELNLNNTELLLKFSDEIPDKTERQLRSDFQQVVLGKPVQYVLGFANFYGRHFKVDSRVLIPEVETAELIDHVKDAELLPLDPDFAILDVGTGSGNIAITLALELKAEKVLAVDISRKALNLARENAQNLSASNVKFVLSDLLDNVTGQFDLIVSNPPYISQGAGSVDKQVLDYEPHQALFAGEDGLDVYRRLIPEMVSHLKKDGYAIFEMDDAQGPAISKLIQASFPKAEPEIFQDMAGLNRFIAWRN
ncbi:peptide chain release factor N(5)-glutamine methyltransferase [Oenococcus kitaharae]|uniref:peptide chain release factor N(5)-glutamine methyltransferase n=1 Tax=Oenococcus kitaharae DSM 17330 TaxID=1045004 RepID=G9WEU0_9LACO|nr:peptide chain release factor N(5)-glutamine methyltransferase [Oenococcus kitaharae]EHN58263.1 Polypeptide chain release factor methylase [Oenococcus kitaharae DSM 17330]OEY81558.1 SAM-dependent methyltransferase [Oenococcus kitaharae]OEY83044.1 SAM-dependent methyltransferase [Oenococcus kitaharae]OEY84410.1 SAM-dependent methyltransferase [Oenococcus kitaharae]